MYPYFGNLRNLSHFGIGIGAYFMQLLVLPVVFFIVGKFVQNKVYNVELHCIDDCFCV
jgi:hypothetical protein